MSERPNIILIMTDQQRADSICALGAPWMETPHLDRLAQEGTVYSNCFVTSPVCVGSRASLFNGVYPHALPPMTNFTFWQPSWVQWLADAGYHCVNIGKMHINPYDAPGGFHQRFPVENKDRPLFLEEHDRAIYDEWDKALHARKLIKPSRYNRYQHDPDRFRQALGAFVWEIDDDMHPDNFVGDQAIWWLQERKATNPLFLQIGFPGPHPPYDPVQSYLDRYRDVTIPVPKVSAEEIAAQPRAQAVLRQNMVDSNFDSVAWQHWPSEQALVNMRRHYAANVSMIDQKVGEILAVLEQRGYLDNALLIFTSDHADALGDHGHIQKWTMYDSVLKVPLILWSPGQINAGQINDNLVQLMDIAPTILAAADIPIPAYWEAQPLLTANPPRQAVYSELTRDHIQSGAEYIVMVRNTEWKLVYYLNEPDGELYHLVEDPLEQHNLWAVQDYAAHRDQLQHHLLHWWMESTLRSRKRSTRTPQQPMKFGP